MIFYVKEERMYRISDGKDVWELSACSFLFCRMSESTRAGRAHSPISSPLYSTGGLKGRGTQKQK